MSVFFTRAAFIGVDIASQPRSAAYAALDDNLRLLALGQGSVEESLAFVGGQQEALVAVHAPPNLNHKLMKDADRRAKLTPPPNPGRYEDLRLAEYLVLTQDLPVYQTPASEKKLKAWQRAGLGFYKKLGELGYKAYLSDGKLRLMESLPEAAFQRWVAGDLLPARSLEGRLQRQLLLYDLDLDLPDPMRFFEELTRYRLLQGQLPEEGLFQPSELNALALAYAAWLAAHRPNQIEWLGDESEGQIALPVG